jgi:hypothetical protein
MRYTTAIKSSVGAPHQLWSGGAVVLTTKHCVPASDDHKNYKRSSLAPSPREEWSFAERSFLCIVNAFQSALSMLAKAAALCSTKRDWCSTNALLGWTRHSQGCPAKGHQPRPSRSRISMTVDWEAQP